MEQAQASNQGMMGILSILFKWKNFIISIVLFFTIVSVAVSFLLPEHFRAKAVLIVPAESNSALGGLTGLLGGKSSAATLGAKFLGMSSASEDMLLGILNSRTALQNVIEKYNLIEYYEIDDKNPDKVLKAFTKDISFSPNEFGLIEIEVVNKNPELAADICNYFYVLLDSLNRKFNVEQAKNQRLFIEKRYLQNVSDLKNAEDSLYAFQKKYGVFAVPEQLEAAVKASAELEAQLVKQEITKKVVDEQYGIYSPQSSILQQEIKLLQDKIKELKQADKLSAPSNVFLPFKEVPTLLLQYYRLFREIEIQSTILEVVLPLYEQAKVEEQKSMPSVMVLDAAVPPRLKDSPKRMFIVGAGFFLSLFFMFLLAIINEYHIKTRENKSILEQKMEKFAVFCKRIFRIK